MNGAIGLQHTLAVLALLLGACNPGAAAAQPARGPLRVHPANPRYFTDGTTASNGELKAVYLAGSHTWANLIDRGPQDPPPVFDFSGYLDFLARHELNFIRLWGRQVSWYHGYGQGELHAAPLAWLRTGPGQALDGKPKFDLTQFDPEYFQRLRTRVKTAGDRGIYVGIMLFGGSYECRDGWRGNPFHRENNINGINGDLPGDDHGLGTQTLAIPAITRLQEAYVRKVIDTVNDLENVLYEIANEAEEASVQWQYHLIRFIQQHEAALPKQHPVGMTALYIQEAKANDSLLLQSGAQWIAPLTDAAGVRDIPAADGAKVRLLDSDHWFVKELYNDPAFGREWVWKAFCRGYHPLLMEHLPPLSFVDPDYPLTTHDTGYTAARRAMAHTRLFARRMNLADLQPSPGLSSTRYCLARPGSEYLVYQPKRGKFSVSLTAGIYRCEWFDAAKGAVVEQSEIEVTNTPRQFEPPFDAEAVCYLKRR